MNDNCGRRNCKHWDKHAEEHCAAPTHEDMAWAGCPLVDLEKPKKRKESHMKIVPVGGKVLVEPEEWKSETEGGILLPDMAKEKPVRGKVLSVGPGRFLPNGTRAKMEVKVGETIIFQRYSGNEIKTAEGKVLLLIQDEDILAHEEA